MSTDKKILIIGQSLPAVKQDLPYDTTMLYDWLREVGVSKKQAQELFEFEAVYGFGFLGFNQDGSHIIPSKTNKDEYYNKILKSKINKSDKVWVLGGVAKNYLLEIGALLGKETLFTIHPSKRNIGLYNKIKTSLISELNKFLNI